MYCSRSNWPRSRRTAALKAGLPSSPPLGNATPARTAVGSSARGGSQLADRGTAAGEEAGFFKEVGGGIAADGELGEDGEARAQIRGAAAHGDDLLKISGEISDRGIDLGERDLHKPSVNGRTGARRPWRGDLFLLQRLGKHAGENPREAVWGCRLALRRARPVLLAGPVSRNP